MTDTHTDTHLGNIEITTGVTVAGQAFCPVRVFDSDGQMLSHGELYPEEVRQLAISWLAAAAEAESEGLIFAAFAEMAESTDSDVDTALAGSQLAGFLVQKIRGVRAHTVEQSPYTLFRCPRCQQASNHPEDIKNGYCSNCHAYTGDPLRADDDPPPEGRP